VTARARRRAVQVGSLLLAAVLLWLALRGVDLAALAQSLRSADWRWLPPLGAVLVLSHWLRAWRWVLLVDGLPPREGARPARTPEAFGALMVGYMVNYVAPRVGEVTRTATLSRRTGQSFSALFGTVVLERLLDVVVLALGLLTLPLLMGSRLEALNESMLGPAAERLASLPLGLMLLAGGTLLGLGLAALWLLRRMARSDGSLVARKLVPLVASFREGVETLRTARARGKLIGLTVVIWALYGMLGFLPFLLLRGESGASLAAQHGLTLLDGWCVTLIGALGLIVPTPGGVGSYHYVTILGLTAVYGVAAEAASAYAVLSHGSQLVLYVALGALSLLVLGAGARRTPARAPGAQTDGSPRAVDG
jgi:uncharacterized protein (TIRG00374 family)